MHSSFITADLTSEPSFSVGIVQAICGSSLATAQVRMFQHGRYSTNIRALCDTGAQVDVISTACAQRLSLRFEKTDVQLHGVDSPRVIHATGIATVGICARNCSEVLTTTKLLLVPGLGMTLPSTLSALPIAGNLELADPTYREPGTVELILGAGTWAALFTESKPIRQPDGRIALNTRLGWIAFGPAVQHNATQLQVSTILADPAEGLDAILVRFWECGEINEQRRPTADELWCEQHFQRTCHRDASGRYVIRLPLKQAGPRLGSSREIAKKRFLLLERRLSNDADLRAKYVAFMRELVQLNHMQKCSRPPTRVDRVFHIPHHAVTKKFRVVFDASCRSNSGTSLNEIQHAGARLQDDLVQIIMRFRQFPVAITADVVKMFRQVRVDEQDWDLQRIFWRESPQDPLEEYWITVVIYGETSSSFNAVRAMQQAGRDHSAQYPNAAQAIAHHFYMDDLLSGAENASAARALCAELTSSLGAGGFELDKWASNSQEVTRPSNKSEVKLSTDESSVLGLAWCPTQDVLRFKCRPIEIPSIITKRTIISNIAKLFDPIGLLAPIIVVGKCLIQDLWRAGQGWDEPVTEILARRWISYNDSLQATSAIEVPRWLRTMQNSDLQLHGFADASTIAFGAVIYLRAERADGTVSCTLLSCKTRIAPVKPVTVPRLELCAAELLSRHMRYVRRVFKTPSAQVRFWTDSEIVLCWIRKSPITLKTFVANRVSSIQDATAGSKWSHVASRDNPADIASRGATATELQASSLWWNGPHWLSRPSDEWPPSKPFTSVVVEQAVLSEERPLPIVIARLELLQARGVDLLSKHSTLSNILRITSYVRRFVHNARVLPSERRAGLPTPAELDDALSYWSQRTQAEHFASEISALRRNGCVPSSSALKTLVPFLAAANVLRLGGRLQHSHLTYDEQHPMILPGKSRLTELLIRQSHFKTLHGGAQLCMQFLRHKFWIINMRQAVKSVINNCVTCTRQRRRSIAQRMGNLPDCRVQQCRAFQKSGVDYAGPITLKERTGRSRTTTKGYIALFVCLVTRAIHLEAVSDLTVGAFIAAFHRFVSRRGHCALLLSDNGRTFVGADNAMRRVSQTWSDRALAEQLSSAGTEWQFITPAAPHQGGIWEAGVKSTKHHLRRVMGNQVFTFEALATVLAQIEACLNSRPLTPLSDDPSDVNALTPGHFLIGEPLVQPLTKDLSDVPPNRLRLWSIVQRTTQAFWKRWHEEYLTTMQQRRKWFRAEPNIAVGDLVLLMNENMPPAKWLMARVIAIHTAEDGLVRSCTVRTATTELQRPVQKLCLLPVPVRAEQPD